MNEKVGLGGGCHWCTEAIFLSVKGVKDVKQGWIKPKERPETFSEGVIVTFNPTQISLKTLIEIHIHTHSAFSKHALSHKYRSAIYTFSSEQLELANKILHALQTEYSRNIKTAVLTYDDFKLNADQYLNYFYKNSDKPFCNVHIKPKLKFLKEKFGDIMDMELMRL